MRRVVLKSPVLENCTPGSGRGALGNQRPYLDKQKEDYGPQTTDRRTRRGKAETLKSEIGSGTPD